MNRPTKLFLFLLIWSAAFSFSLYGETSTPSSPETVRTAPLPRNEFSKSIEEISALVRQGSFLEARTRYQILLKQNLSKEDQGALEKDLETLNMKILFSKIETPDSISYTVKSGDVLYLLAKKYHTTVELIQRSNQLKGEVIRPGMKLKISKAAYSISVDKSDNRLKLFSDGTLLKTYSVATGRNNSTPVGTFKITDKLINPTWYKTGAVLPPGSPKNILGTRWLGFSLKSYGIHGTTLPETIGKQASDGCVRMLNADVEELYDILPANTPVTITD